MDLQVDVEVAQATANAIARAEVLVRRHKHPLNRGRSPEALLGLEGGRYSPHDRVGIVVDSLRLFRVRSHSRLSLSEDDKLAAKRKREEDAKLKAHPTFPQVADGGASNAADDSNAPRFNCECAAKNPKLLVPSADGDSMVCSSCGTCGEKITVSQSRQKQCASEEDKTQVADAPSEVRDRFDEAATSVQVARQLKKEDTLVVRRTLTKKDRRLLGWAPEKCNRLSDRAEKERGNLSAENQDRELRMLFRVDELFKMLDPMPDELKRYVRVEAWTFFQTYAKHESVCDEACCRFTGIRGKGVKGLAATCVAATLEQLEDGTCTVDVDPQQLRGVLDRNAELEKSASIRTAVCELRHFLDAGNDEKEMPPCESGAKTVAEEIAAEDEEKRIAEELAEQEGGAFGRQLRTFLRKLTFVEGNELVAHTIDFYVGKYETIQSDLEASDLSWPAKAFVAMEVAARFKEGIGLKAPSSRMRPIWLNSLGATELQIMQLVCKIYDRATAGSSQAHTRA
jgi:hypothetical protein